MTNLAKYGGWTLCPKCGTPHDVGEKCANPDCPTNKEPQNDQTKKTAEDIQAMMAELSLELRNITRAIERVAGKMEGR